MAMLAPATVPEMLSEVSCELLHCATATAGHHLERIVGLDGTGSRASRRLPHIAPATA
jgi:hypothetical protein